MRVGALADLGEDVPLYTRAPGPSPVAPLPSQWSRLEQHRVISRPQGSAPAKATTGRAYRAHGAARSPMRLGPKTMKPAAANAAPAVLTDLAGVDERLFLDDDLPDDDELEGL